MSSARILTLDDDNFDDEIDRREGPILVDFWAAWCAPCKLIEARLSELADELADRAWIAKVDIEANGDLANRFGIMSVPTLVVFRAGKVVDQIIGAAPKQQIREVLERHL